MDLEAIYELPHLRCLQIQLDLSFGTLTLLHSERPKLHGVLAILSAVGLKFFSITCIGIV